MRGIEINQHACIEHKNGVAAVEWSAPRQAESDLLDFEGSDHPDLIDPEVRFRLLGTSWRCELQTTISPVGSNVKS